MATFNGEPHLAAQIASILAQLDPTDELVIVDDASTDGTVGVIRAINDSRIRLVELARNQGHVETFQRALMEARGEYLMLSDQDDVWTPGRADLMISALSNAHFVAGNLDQFGARQGGLANPLRPAMSRLRWRNIIGLALGRRAYFGCAMGLRRELLTELLPFPPGLEAHDHWLAVVANLWGRFPHLEQAVVQRRIHASNLTPPSRRAWPAILRSRLRFSRLVLVAVRRRFS